MKLFGFIFIFTLFSTVAVAQTDQELSFATYFGGENLEASYDLARASNGNIYIVGSTFSNSNIASAGSHQTELNGITDGFILALDSNYNILWSTYFGGEDSDVIYGVTSLSDNSLIVTGLTQSLTGISTSGVLQEDFGGNWDMFVSRFNEDGELIWSTYYGGDLGDIGWSVISNESDDIYIGGESFSQGLGTTGVFQDSLLGDSRDGLLVKLNSDGELQWCTYYGGIGGDNIIDLALNSDAEICIFGGTSSIENISTIGTYQEELANATSGNDDAFIAKIDDTGNRVWGTYYGGEAFDFAYSIKVDIENNIIVSGSTSSDSNIVSIGAHKVENQLGDANLASFSNSGNMNWGTYFGGESYEIGEAVIDIVGTDVYMVGQTVSDSNISFGAPYKPYNSVPNVSDFYLFPDMYIVKFNSNGVQQWGTYYGDVEKDNVRNVIMLNEHSLALVGFTESTLNMVSDDAFQSEISGDNSTLFAVFDVDIEVGINEHKRYNANVYPNPASKNVTVSIKDQVSTEGELEILTVDGRKVLRLDNYTTNTPLSIDFTPGLYMVRLFVDEKQYISKLIIE